MLVRASLCYSKCLKPLSYQCKKCVNRNSTLRGIPCSAGQNNSVMGREYHLINDHMIEQCPYFTPKNKRVCFECNFRYECIT